MYIPFILASTFDCLADGASIMRLKWDCDIAKPSIFASLRSRRHNEIFGFGLAILNENAAAMLMKTVNGKGQATMMQNMRVERRAHSHPAEQYEKD